MTLEQSLMMPYDIVFFDISSKTLPVTPSGWLAMRNRHSESTDEA